MDHRRADFDRAALHGYDVQGVLGEGAYGVVRKVRATQNSCACLRSFAKFVRMCANFRKIRAHVSEISCTF